MGTAALTASLAAKQKATAGRVDPLANFRAPAPVLRRRGNLQQGFALETLGHAVEYLVDSSLFQAELGSREAHQEAIQILMRVSRAVFDECPEVLPLRTRLRRHFARLLRRPHRQPSRPAC